MSILSATPFFDPNGVSRGSGSSSTLVKSLRNAGQFLRDLQMQLRFGELTRAPLRMRRFQVSEDGVECDWMARSPDPWDADLPTSVGQRHASLQALKDAIDIRNLLFFNLPEVDTAFFRVYRSGLRCNKELIITGNSERRDSPSRGVHSLAMRAQLLGFRFLLENGILHAMPDGEPQRRVSNASSPMWGKGF